MTTQIRAHVVNGIMVSREVYEQVSEVTRSGQSGCECEVRLTDGRYATLTAEGEIERDAYRPGEKLEGFEAIEYAESHGGLTLNKYADPVENAREGLTPAEARAVAREDRGLIYLEVKESAIVAADAVREHIAANARPSSKGWWLPAVWSEGCQPLRAALVEELGRPRASGYMSEECGWEIDPEDYDPDYGKEGENDEHNF